MTLILSENSRLNRCKKPPRRDGATARDESQIKSEQCASNSDHAPSSQTHFQNRVSSTLTLVLPSLVFAYLPASQRAKHKPVQPGKPPGGPPLLSPTPVA
ncbi:hypothetical protein L596_016334 [Steinernema carpocapsae]|uniref:Uncharacterized protein n=1 Tax=Steinernema carpocapsae TaxID=34508 RepID=A0A4U5NIR5_STECR|nr:hypothetical protein L596_016334 [Steinernema carpocapsae]